jgi:hypothetical protein
MTNFSKLIPSADFLFDRIAVQNHVELVHRCAHGIDGLLVVSAFFEGRTGTITHHKVGDVGGMVAATMAHANTPGANVYTGLHVMRTDLPRGSRGTEKDIVAVLGLVADLDADTGKVGAMPIEPSYIVETSPGNRQAVIVFNKPMSAKDAKPHAKALQKQTGADYGSADVTHIWRIPGTLNYANATKIARGRNPEPVPVLMTQPFEGLVYSHNDLSAVLNPCLSETVSESEVRFGEPIDTAPLRGRLSDISVALLMADGQPDRSAHLARVVEQLGFEGCTLDEVGSLCLERAGAWTDRYGDDDVRFIRDIERCWQKFVARKEAERKANDEAAQEFLRNHRSEDDPTARLIVPVLLSHDPAPFILERPGGLITDVARFVFDTSPSPIPDFSIMSAVALHAGLFGRRWLTPDGLGLNLYIAHVAGSGFGKDRPLKAMAQLAESVGHGHIIGPNDVASDSALEMILRQHPSQVLPLDELGMLLSASGRSSDAYARARRKAMLELYSSATSSWVAKTRASDFQNGQQPKPKIQWPTLSFLGATTPSTFYEGLEDDAFRSGFIARLIVVAVDQPPKRQRIDGYPEVPQPLIDRLSEALSFEAVTPAFAKVMAAESATKPRYSTARWADDATAFRLEQIRDWARDVGIADERRGQIVNRAGDHTSKLATIRAISRCPKTPVVIIDDIEWAFGIVLRSIRTVEEGADRFMSGSPFEALCKAIVEAVRQSKDPKGLKNSDLLRKPGVSHADEKMVHDAISRLVTGTGLLKNVGTALGRAGRGGRYVLTTFH